MAAACPARRAAAPTRPLIPRREPRSGRSEATGYRVLVTPLQVTVLVLVLVATVVGVAVFASGVARIVATIRIGRPLPGRWRPVGPRLVTLLSEVLLQLRFRGRVWVGIAHWAVMVSFPVLFLTLVSGYGQVVDPSYSLPVIGHLAPLEWLTEGIAWASLAGIVYLIALRQVVRPRRGSAVAERRRSRFFGSSQAQAVFVEATVLLVVLAVLVLRGLEYALAARAGSPIASAWHFPLTAWYGAAWSGAGTTSLETAVVLTATVKILGSMAWFVVVGVQPTMGVAWHRFLALVNVYARRRPSGGPALGPLAPMRAPDGSPLDLESLGELPDDARLGVGAVEDLTWKALLDVATCTECGRCQEQCPAWATGKPLSPKLLVLALRDQAAAAAPYVRAARAAGSPGSAAGSPTASATTTTVDGRYPIVTDPHLGMDLVGSGVIDPDVLWSCTMCGACVQQCPVDIEHVDLIADLRRYQVLMESAFPAELTGTFTKLERRGNPWGMPARGRLDWAKGLPFEVPVIGVDVESAADVEYLFWVGCAGAYEDRAKRTTRAVAELLHIAGVSFAVLGERESCSGDSARRAGNELLFQTLASGNVETLNEAKVTKIVTACAHCFNTLAREYPQLGGRYDVVHHTELLNRLVVEGRLTPIDRSADDEAAASAATGPSAASGSSPATEPSPATGSSAATEPSPARGSSPASTPIPPTRAPLRITYHDPCFLGRHNQVYAPPRELIAAIPGVELAEMPRSGSTSFCCGAGGARMWMEETIGTRIGTARAEEAIATGADAIATACPYCTVMLSDGVAAVASAASSTPSSGDAAPGTADPSGAPAGANGRGPAGRPSAVSVPQVADIAVLLLERIRPASTD
ncbi:MAG: Fe-S oxidoreductase [Microbacterium sp. 14-71-5]|nr:MAG: Fe-S oxidoreductase [Microbacterium sp. 14-71-5]